MREIKFKFWLGHTKKMTYAHHLSEVHSVIPSFTPDIICLQYTGLTDKNGVGIYEGDYVIAANGSKSVVMFGEWEYDFQGEEDNIWNGIGFYWDNGEPFGSAKNNGGLLFEVIGNKYEYPHLLT